MLLDKLNKKILTQMFGLHGTCARVRGAMFSDTTRRQTGGSTIYALSSGYGKCGVAVVRISGAEARRALDNMTKLKNFEPRKAFLRKIYDPKTQEIIDKGLCLWFPGPNSFTGEDCVEFHVHGGPAILASLMSALVKLEFHPALPGEFTRRAFYNNKLDLTEVEGLADLIHAETEQQRKQALLQADGNLSKLYNNWRKILAQCIANLEAYIDFSEEDNIEGDVLQRCNDSLRELAEKIENHLADGRKGEILRNGVRTVIIGEPNVGKSSLLNRLVQRNAAIVTPIAGTTRDIVELPTNISGYPVILADTAGLTKFTEDVVETEGIRRAKAYAENADFIILLVDALKFFDSGMAYADYIQHYINTLEIGDLLLKESYKRYAVVLNKTDLLNDRFKESLKDIDAATISCETEEGFQDLLGSLTEHIKHLCGNPSQESPTISQSRYRNHLTHCLNHMKRYFEIISDEQHDIVLAVQQIRLATREIGKITGNVSTEEILEIIFKNFCIGK